MLSKFNEDLENENKLADFLDKSYYIDREIFSEIYVIQRVHDMNLQYEGVDLIITDKANDFQVYIDEKAQSHYINKSLPTFAFELSYIKDEKLKTGWLYDSHKKTHQYFIITCIQEINNIIKSCRLISVDRNKLINWLRSRKLSQEVFINYDHKLRAEDNYGKHYIDELSPKEGFLFYTEHLSEKPINIVLYINILIQEGIGVELFPCRL